LGRGEQLAVSGFDQGSKRERIVFIGAAGNEPVITPFYPAAYQPDVMAVTAVDPGRLRRMQIGAILCHGAPGRAWCTSTIRLIRDGTSASAAYVSGNAGGFMWINTLDAGGR